MNRKSARFRAVDVLLIAMIILPLAAGMALKILTTPASEGIEISGARIYFTIPMPVQELPITESQVNSWLVMISILGLCLYLVHGVTVKPGSRRQLAAEWIVEKTNGLVGENMGKRFMGFAPFVAGIMALSAFSSLMSLIGLPDFRYERRGRMGDSGVRAHHPLQAQGRPWALCEGLLRAGAGLCAL